MLNINQIILSGLVVNDPLARETHSGATLVTFMVRHTHSYANPDGGTNSRAYSRSIAAYGKTAAYIQEHVRAGQTVLVTGALRDVEDKGRTKLDAIVATSIQIVYAAEQQGVLR